MVEDDHLVLRKHSTEESMSWCSWSRPPSSNQMIVLEREGHFVKILQERGRERMCVRVYLLAPEAHRRHLRESENRVDSARSRWVSTHQAS